MPLALIFFPPSSFPIMNWKMFEIARSEIGAEFRQYLLATFTRESRQK